MGQEILINPNPTGIPDAQWLSRIFRLPPLEFAYGVCLAAECPRILPACASLAFPQGYLDASFSPPPGTALLQWRLSLADEADSYLRTVVSLILLSVDSTYPSLTSFCSLMPPINCSEFSETRLSLVSETLAEEQPGKKSVRRYQCVQCRAIKLTGNKRHPYTQPPLSL